MAVPFTDPAGHAKPAGQGKQTEADAREYVPPGHCTGAPQPQPHEDPAGHGEHTTFPVPPMLNVPLPHSIWSHG